MIYAYMGVLIVHLVMHPMLDFSLGLDLRVMILGPAGKGAYLKNKIKKINDICIPRVKRTR